MSDTLSVDTSRVAAWLNSGNYDYAHQLARPERNWWQELMEWLNEHLFEWQTKFENWTPTEVAGLLLGLLLLCIALYWLWRNRYRWTGRFSAPVRPVDYTISDDNIYGIDFDEALSQALRDENYAEALRIIYLRHLRRLSDAGKIEWKPQCTPDTYVYELPPGSDRDALRQLTGEYVRVRFGHYPATREQVEALLNKEGGRR